MISDPQKAIISVVIPFFNEEENIPSLVDELQKAAGNLRHVDLEVVFVDDGSKDGSLEHLKRRTAVFRSVRIVRLSRNFGSQAALRAGILYAKGSYVVFFPADMQYSFDLIAGLYEKCREGYDLAIAERADTEDGWVERLTSWLYARLLRKFTLIDFPKKGFDVAMFNGKVQAELIRHIEANSSIGLQMLSLGFKRTTVPCYRTQRRSGRSKWTLRKKIKLFIDSFVAFTNAPIRFISIAGIFITIIGLFWAIFVLGRSLFFHGLSPREPILIPFLLLGFGLTNVSLGIIAEYLWRTLDESRKRPVFVIDEIIEPKET